MLKIGQIAPDFTLPDQNGVNHTLSQYKGHFVLLYFYPKDNTPGCTAEACSLRDSLAEFENLDTVVLGVSIDTKASHKSFTNKYNLPFTLLADTDKKVVNLYQVWALKKFMGREYMGTQRTSFLIGKDGIIIKIYEDVKPTDHSSQVLKDLKSLH